MASKIYYVGTKKQPIQESVKTVIFFLKTAMFYNGICREARAIFGNIIDKNDGIIGIVGNIIYGMYWFRNKSSLEISKRLAVECFRIHFIKQLQF